MCNDSMLHLARLAHFCSFEAIIRSVFLRFCAVKYPKILGHLQLFKALGVDSLVYVPFSNDCFARTSAVYPFEDCFLD